jgi:arylsulfatase A-like enzyme/Flp pilus assembly protein TadD
MPPARKYTLFLLVVLVAAFVFYTYVQFQENRKRAAIEQNATTRRNIYLLTAAGLRPDHLSSYLYQPIQTPAIDYLAYDGVRFSNAFSTSPESLAAHLSLLTGVYPFHEPVSGSLNFLFGLNSKRPPSDLESIPSFLKNQGYLTAAFLSEPELRLPSFFLQWFDSVFCGDKLTYDWQPSYSVPRVTEIASDWVLKNRSHPHFVWINFDEPTIPFAPPAPYDRHYQKHPYDGEIAALDEQVGLFMNLLKARGIFRQSIVILASPFGERVQTSGARFASLSEGTLRIPLIFTAPGILPTHQLYTSTASLVDVFPTLLALLQKTPSNGIDGDPLFEKGTSRELVRDYLFSETILPQFFGIPPQFAIQTKGGKHWISSQENSGDPENKKMNDVLRKTGIPFLPPAQAAALDYDPGVLLSNVYDLARKGKPLLGLDLLQSAVEKKSPSAYLLELSGQLKEAAGDSLSALNYYSAAREIRPDPDLLDRMARVLIKLNHYDQAMALEKSLPNQQTSYFHLSTKGLALFYVGKYSEAVETLSEAIKQNPYYAEAYLDRGTAFRHLGNIEKAESDLKRAIELDSQDPVGYQRLANLLIETPRKLEAIPYLRKLLELETEDYGVMVQLAELHYDAGNNQLAQKLLADVITKSHDSVAKQEAKNLLAQH